MLFGPFIQNPEQDLATLLSTGIAGVGMRSRISAVDIGEVVSCGRL